MGARVMVMAGGTGGHVFPALAVAEELQRRGIEVFWLGVRGGFESRVVPEAGIRMEWVSVQGLRGSGVKRLVLAPFKLSLSMIQSLRVLRRNRPGAVLGMGGFVTGPGGVMTRLLGIPLVIHEQNAVPGMTNRWLSRIASRVLEAFPGSFLNGRDVRHSGNPVRSEIAALPDPEQRIGGRSGPIRLLVLGGSQGAQALNEQVPAALGRLDALLRPLVRHQAGRGKDEPTRAAYESAGIDAEVAEFITDMAAAYEWADLVICRAGALTLAELSAAGVGAILVPFPHAVDDHQTRNAGYMTDVGAARLLPQSELTPETLETLLKELLQDRGLVTGMAVAARRVARPDATSEVADVVEEVLKQ
jgi:UDP-N-acetylglucosamine--N-acetylmuramyl-(pentapeptide) pyrophosphoryl-undecaprenol N-acetylglucosamine transferase